MRIQDFRGTAPAQAAVIPPPAQAAAPPAAAAPAAEARSVAAAADTKAVIERQGVEIALLKARIEHLEIVVETARGLLGSNQERLLRRLYDLPKDIVKLSQRLQRSDVAMPW